MTQKEAPKTAPKTAPKEAKEEHYALKKGDLEITTSLLSEANELRSQGFTDAE